MPSGCNALTIKGERWSQTDRKGNTLASSGWTSGKNLSQMPAACSCPLLVHLDILYSCLNSRMEVCAGHVDEIMLLASLDT